MQAETRYEAIKEKMPLEDLTRSTAASTELQHDEQFYLCYASATPSNENTATVDLSKESAFLQTVVWEAMVTIATERHFDRQQTLPPSFTRAKAEMLSNNKERTRPISWTIGQHHPAMKQCQLLGFLSTTNFTWYATVSMHMESVE